MKIFSCEQIREIDRYTVTNDPVASVDLMERAAGQLLKWCLKNIDRSRRIIIIAGPGNNGGDGMALARLLHANRYMAEVCYIGFSERTTEDWNINRKRLESETTVSFRIITDAEQLPFLSSDDIVIDALFGSGLTRPVDGIAASVIRAVNMSECLVISVDIPSGLFGEDNSNNDQETIIRADFTLTFQFPKLSFMFAENAKYTGEWVILPIGLSNQAIRNTNTPYSLLDNEFILPLLRKRNRFDHKGLFGHALLVAGSRGKIGAAVLGARAALRTGVGLLTCHIPASGSAVIHTAVPEAMVRARSEERRVG